MKKRRIRAGEVRESEGNFNVYQVLVWKDEKLRVIIVMVIQCCEHTWTFYYLNGLNGKFYGTKYSPQ